MNNSVKISLVCPCYNSGNYIDRLINTIISQTKKIDEVIFSDDGSIDDTVIRLKSYEKLFISKNIKLCIQDFTKKRKLLK